MKMMRSKEKGGTFGEEEGEGVGAMVVLLVLVVVIGLLLDGEVDVCGGGCDCWDRRDLVSARASIWWRTVTPAARRVVIWWSDSGYLRRTSSLESYGVETMLAP